MQQLHLDSEGDDVDEAERQVVALGRRRLPDPQDVEDFRVYAELSRDSACPVFNT